MGRMQGEVAQQLLSGLTTAALAAKNVQRTERRARFLQDIHVNHAGQILVSNQNKLYEMGCDARLKGQPWGQRGESKLDQNWTALSQLRRNLDSA